MTERIVALCRALGAGEEGDDLLLPLVEAVRTALAARLKPGVAPEDCGPAFPLACAMAAVDGLNAAGGGEDISSFTAGVLTIRREAGRGRRLAEQGEALLAPWLAEEGFAFRGVRG